jgi:hypothetical protein
MVTLSVDAVHWILDSDSYSISVEFAGFGLLKVYQSFVYLPTYALVS